MKICRVCFRQTKRPDRNKYCSRECYYISRKQTPIHERFWPKVEKHDECWEWIGAKKNNGYGFLRIPGLNGKPLDWGAHRISWSLHFGEIPKEKHVLHKCDNRSCVNPKHLFLGTNKDNVDDKMKKGRHHSLDREHNPRAKLTTKLVIEIRNKYSSGKVRQIDLATEYGIGQTTVSQICRNETWKLSGTK
jgi:HNH endonuclease/CENP-B N-terminal DNA-binding domain